MRNVFSLIVISLLTATSGIFAGVKAPIEPNLESALAKSRATGRPVIADFHAVY